MASSDTDKAYFAGILDGEGYIGLAPKARDVIGEYVTPMVLLGNTNKAMMEWITARFAGTWSERQPANPEKHKLFYKLSWRSAKAISILREVLPYLVAKRQQAELAISVWDAEQHTARNQYQNPLPAHVKAFRSAAYLQTRILNRKGPALVLATA